VIRHCDGSDDNLTREIPPGEFDAVVMTASVNWDRIGQRLHGNRVIRCSCGLSFDDADRKVTYPHEPFCVESPVTLAHNHEEDGVLHLDGPAVCGACLLADMRERDALDAARAGIIREHRACETMPNGTGYPCTCDFDCVNYWLRAKGYGAS
jgi:hypothetical protein